MTKSPTPGVEDRLRRRVEPGATALLIIDMSNDFVHDAGKAAAEGGRDVGYAQVIVPLIQALASTARSSGVLVVHCQHATLPDGRSASPVWLDARAHAAYSAVDICLSGTWGHQIIDELAPEPGDVIIEKTRYGAFTGTSLETILRSSRRSNVICCGVSTNVCVDTTARQAFHAEFFVTIAHDACASWDMDLHDAALKTASSRFALVASTHDIRTAIEAQRKDIHDR